MKTIIFNVSGKLFEIDVESLSNKPHTRLGKIAINLKSEPEEICDNKTPIFFNRSASSFESIFNYHQTDELHMPVNVCPGAFRKELEYWGLDPRSMETCCRFKYLEFLNNHDTTTAFYASIKASEKIYQRDVRETSPVKQFRARLWSILDQKESTVISRVGFCLHWILINIS